MSIQQQFKTSNAAPINRKMAMESLSVGCVSRPTPHRETACPDAFAATCLSIIRYIAAAYATGEAACWEMSLRLADEATGTEYGPLLVARLSMLIRIIRRIGTHELVCLPAPCNRLTVEEQQLMLMIEAARHNDQDSVVTAASIFVGNHHCAELIQAADMIGCLSLDAKVAHLCDRTSSSPVPVKALLSSQLDCLGCPASPLAMSGQSARR